MFTVTQDQKYVISILDATKMMRKGQAVRLLSKLGAEYTDDYALRCLLQLKYIRKIAWKTDDLFAVPMMFNEPIDEDMLSAVDVMLDLTEKRILSIAAGPEPYKLRFLSASDKGSKGFAVIALNAGIESRMKSLLAEAPEGYTIIFLLSNILQKDRVETSLPHYFAIRDGGKYRYFRKG